MVDITMEVVTTVPSCLCTGISPSRSQGKVDVKLENKPPHPNDEQCGSWVCRRRCKEIQGEQCILLAAWLSSCIFHPPSGIWDYGLGVWTAFVLFSQKLVILKSIRRDFWFNFFLLLLFFFSKAITSSFKNPFFRMWPRATIACHNKTSQLLWDMPNPQQVVSL